MDSMGNSGSVFFLILRRMRVPLIVLIVIYAISVLGLTLVPGVDANGQPAPHSVFSTPFISSATPPPPSVLVKSRMPFRMPSVCG